MTTPNSTTTKKHDSPKLIDKQKFGKLLALWQFSEHLRLSNAEKAG
jgi:hypothetical protein